MLFFKRQKVSVNTIPYYYRPYSLRLTKNTDTDVTCEQGLSAADWELLTMRATYPTWVWTSASHTRRCRSPDSVALTTWSPSPRLSTAHSPCNTLLLSAFSTLVTFKAQLNITKVTLIWDGLLGNSLHCSYSVAAKIKSNFPFRIHFRVHLYQS